MAEPSLQIPQTTGPGLPTDPSGQDMALHRSILIKLIGFIPLALLSGLGMAQLVKHSVFPPLVQDGVTVLTALAVLIYGGYRVISSQIGYPLALLHRALRLGHDGGVYAPVPLTRAGSGEVGELLVLFNQMLARLEEHQDYLDDQEHRLREDRRQLDRAQRACGIGWWRIERLDRPSQEWRVSWSSLLAELAGLPDHQQDPSWPRLLALVHTDDRGQLLGILAKSEGSLEFRLCQPGGTVRRMLAQYRRDGDTVAGIIQDITETHQREARIAAAERHLTAAVDQSSVGLAIFDPEDRLILCNDVFAGHYGAHATELAGKLLDDLSLRDPVPAAATVRRMAVRRAEGYSLQRQIADDRWLLIRYRIAAGGELVVTLTDISDLKQAEALLRERERQLAFGNLVLRAEQEASPDAILVIGQGGRAMSYNRRFLTLWDVPEEQLIYGNRDTIAALLARRLPDGAVAILGDATTEDPAVTVEDSLALLDGRIIQRYSRGLVDRDGVVYGRIWFYRDVSEARTREQALRDSNCMLQQQARELANLAAELDSARAEAEAANSAKSRFLTMISHELRTPLTGIVGMADLLTLTPTGDDAERYVETLRDSAHVLLALLNQLLDFAKIEAGHLTLEDSDFVLSDLIGSVAALFHPAARAKGLDLVVRIGDGVPTGITSDANRLRQILSNLVGNAVKFTRAGRVMVEVTWLAERDPPALRLTVSDTGIGMREDQICQLFQPFVQADTSISRSYGGTGLGLAICRMLADAMGGSIEVSSTPGAGSIFYLTLPVRIADAPKSLPGTETPHLIPADRFLRLLMADDNPVNRMLVVQMLRRFGHDVDAVETGEMAVELAAGGGYDALLLDLRMPDMDGFAAARAIRQLPAPAGRLPIIALTADADPALLPEVLAAGMDGLLTKPIDWDHTHAMLVRVVAGLGMIAPLPTRPGQAGDHAEELALPLIDEDRFGELKRALAPADLADICHMFIDSLREQAQIMQRVVRSADGEELRRVLHTIRGIAGNVGAVRLEAVTLRLSDYCQDEDMAGLDRGLAMFERVLADTAPALDLARAA